VAELKTLVLGQKTIDDLDDRATELPNELMTVNMGPSHPAMHGTVRIVLTVDGERVVAYDIQPGYLHRCFEKESEYATYTQVFPYTDRLNYVSPMINNVGYAMAVEKLMGITDEIPERATYIRVIVSEISRITDHLTCVGASAMELGAFTPFLYLIKCREWLYRLLEELCGARLTVSYLRIGGLVQDLTDNFAARWKKIAGEMADVLVEVEGMLNNNRIFRGRMEGVGPMTGEQALAYGVTGPCLRACGIDYDVRKDYPYLAYDRLDFDVPVGTTGDCFDRYLVRVAEIRQSMRMVDQCLAKLPDGPIMLDDPRVALPPKAETYNTIEAMIRHFKHIMDGIRVPPGEAYAFVEGGNGELGFFVVADGTGRPWKCYCRAPSFVNLQSVGPMIQGSLISDIVPIFGMINMIGGECDK
jgi:NADH-quinone oxidoreductase subunit D